MKMETSTSRNELTQNQLAAFRTARRLQDPDAEAEARFNFQRDTQREVLSYFLCCPGIMERLGGVTKASYFTDHIHQRIFRLAQKHWKQHGTLAGDTYLLEHLKRISKNDTKFLHAKVELKNVRECYEPGMGDRPALEGLVRNYLTIEGSRKAFLDFFDAVGNYEDSGTAFLRLRQQLEDTKNIVENTGRCIPTAKPWVEIVEDAREQFDWYIEDYLPKGTVKIISGAGKDGKSCFLAGLVVDCIYGERVLGRRALSRPTIWLDFDDNPLWHPVEMMEAAIGERDVSQFAGNIMLFSNHYEHGEPSGLPPYLTREWLSSVCERLDEPGIIVLDSFRPAFFRKPGLEAGFDIDPYTVGNLLRPFVQFAHETGWTIIIVHHDNRSGTYAGSNEFLNACDSMDHFEKVQGSEELRHLRTIGGRRVPLTTRILRFEDGRYRYYTAAEADDKTRYAKQSTLAHFLVELAQDRTFDNKDQFYEKAKRECANRNIGPAEKGITQRDVRKLVDRFIEVGIVVKGEDGYRLADNYTYEILLELVLEQPGLQ